MKGLVYKDFYALAQYKNNLYIIVIVGLVLSMTQSTGVVMIPSFTMFICCTYFIGLFTLDDSVHWLRFQGSLPVSAGKAVTARYIVCYGCLAGMGAIALLLSYAVLLFRPLFRGVFNLGGEVMSASALAVATFVVFLMCVMVITVLLPLCYKLGAEKVRIALYLVYAGVVGICVIVLLLFGDAFDKIIPSSSSRAAFVIVLVICAAVLLLLVLGSHHLSARIHAKKEY